ncbi:MAG: hypothetical protein IJV19_03595 [Prevotella sp.]|nr:hypothetical protein [Prevotella sp.]
MAWLDRGYSTLEARLRLSRSEVTGQWQRGYGSVAARLRLTSGEVTPLFEAQNTS